MKKEPKEYQKVKVCHYWLIPFFSCKFPISKQFLLAGQDELPAIEAVYQS